MANLTQLDKQRSTASNSRTGLFDWQILVMSLVVFAAASSMFFFHLGDYPLFNPDEGLYAEPAREMVETGQYTTTLLNYVVRYTKPPLVMWAMAASYHLLGDNEFAARSFGAACGAILATITCLFAAKYINRRAGMFSAAILITSPLFLGVGRTAITDMPLSLFVSGSLFSFYHGFAQKQARYRWLAYTLVALAIMTKGPVGALLPCAILGAFHLSTGTLLPAWQFYRPIAGAALTAAIAVPWFAVEIWLTKGAYYQEFIVRENFQRFTSVVDHKAPWWYHIAAMVGGLMPWSIFLPATFVSLSQTLKKSLRVTSGTPLQRLAIFKSVAPVDSVLLFSALASLIVLTFFSMSVSKLMPYTLPAFPFMAILVSYYFDRAVASERLRGLGIGFAVLLAACSGVYMMLPFALSKLRDCPSDLPSAVSSIVATLLLAALVGLIGVLRRKPTAALALFSTAMIVSILSLGAPIIDTLSNSWEVPLCALAQYAAVSKWPLIVFDMRKPAVAFYTHKHAIIPPDKKALAQDLSMLQQAYVLAPAKDASSLQKHDLRLVVKLGKYLLYAWRNPQTVSADHSAEIISTTANLDQ